MKTYASQSGSITLGLVFGLGMLGLSIAATTLIFATTAVTNNGNATQGIRTLVTADAAAREGVYRVIDEMTGTTTTFTNTSIPLINDANAVVNATGTWPIFTIYSTSTNPRITRRIQTELNMFPSGFAFEQAVYTNGSILITGSASTTGDVYSTDGIEFNGNGSDVDGNVNTPADIDPPNPSNVTGSSTDNYQTIEPPEINITPYEMTAAAAGTAYGVPLYTPVTQADADISGNVVSGTYYVDGDLALSGNNTDFTGTLVVTGNLAIQGGTYTADSDNPMVIYVAGNLTLGGGVNLNGIIFVEGETSTASGNANITGSLISVNSGGDMTISGSLDIIYDSNYAEAWTEIVGIDTDSGNDPQILNWHEE